MGAAGHCGGGPSAYGERQTVRHHPQAYEYMDQTVEGNIEKGGQVYNVEDIVMERAREMQIARMGPRAGVSLSFAAELKKIFNTLKSQDEFNMERLEAVGLTGDSEEYVVKMMWVGLNEEETTWEPVSTIYADTPKYLVAQLRTLGLTKKVRDDLKKKYGMDV